MSELKKIKFIRKSADEIRQYEKLNPAVFNKMRAVSKRLRGKTIIHVNATAFGGGVAEILKSQVALERYFGLKSLRLIIGAPLKFFEITKKIHNLLQGKSGALKESEKTFYFNVNRELGASLKKILKSQKSGIIVIHDPQPLPIIKAIPKNFRAILRIHIDLSTPNPTMVETLRPYIEKYPKVILSHKDYKKFLPKLSSIKIIPPAIDPLSPKNRRMDIYAAKRILEKVAVSPGKPIVSQISRFDPWKDPLGVIRAFYLAKNKIPDLVLLLVGFFLAKDDPEAISVFKTVKKYARSDPDIYLFEDVKDIKDVTNDQFINAVQTASDIVIQKSLREGFGLTITEAMWKEKPVIAGKTKGALLQIKNNKNGILVNSPEEAAKAIVRLIKNEKLRNRLGKAARRSVKNRFLIPKFVLENIKIYSSLIA